MKKLVGTVAALTLLSASSVFAASFNPATDSDVVGYYTFNEGVTENEVVDHSVNAINAETGNLDGTVTVEGLDGLSMLFNGDTEYIQVDPEVLTGEGFTFAAWVKPQQWSNFARLFDFGDRKVDMFFACDGRTAGTLTLWEESTTDHINVPLPKLDQWTHLAASFGNGKLTIYVNGKVAAEGKCDITPAKVAETASGLYIGRSNWADPLYKGEMDEIVLVKRSLSSKEVADLYKPLSKKAKSMAAAVEKAAKAARAEKAARVKKAGTLSLSKTEGIVGFYTFESVADHEVTNAVEGGNSIYTGALEDSVLVKGKNGNAIKFANGEYIDLDEDAFANDGITIAMWVNASAWADWSRLFDLGDTVHDAWLGVEGGSGRLRFDAFGGAKNCLLVTSLPELNTWAHIAVTFGDGFARLYVNGILEAEQECDATASMMAANYNGLYVGRSNWSDPLFSGAIDELLVADRVLTADEVAAAYNGVKN